MNRSRACGGVAPRHLLVFLKVRPCDDIDRSHCECSACYRPSSSCCVHHCAYSGKEGHFHLLVLQIYDDHIWIRQASIMLASQSISYLIIIIIGGHTTEMLLLIKNLASLPQFGPYYFVLSHSDETSASKIKTSNLPILEDSINISWHTVHRSREVRQSWFTTVFTTLTALVQSFDLVCRTLPSVIICNGPGTCVPICYSAYFLKLLLLPVQRYSPSIVFVESFCRVQHLSLTGRLLYPIADKFIVQWPQLLADKRYPRAISLSGGI